MAYSSEPPRRSQRIFDSDFGIKRRFFAFNWIVRTRVTKCLTIVRHSSSTARGGDIIIIMNQSWVPHPPTTYQYLGRELIERILWMICVRWVIIKITPVTLSRQLVCGRPAIRGSEQYHQTTYSRSVPFRPVRRPLFLQSAVWMDWFDQRLRTGWLAGCLSVCSRGKVEPQTHMWTFISYFCTAAFAQNSIVTSI